MMQSRKEAIDRIRADFPIPLDTSVDLNEESVLADLGVASLHLITLIMKLKRQCDLDIDQLSEVGMPTTVGDLVTLLTHEPK